MGMDLAKGSDRSVLTYCSRDVRATNFVIQMQEADREIQTLNAALKKAGFRPLGTGPLADVYVFENPQENQCQ